MVVIIFMNIIHGMRDMEIHRANPKKTQMRRNLFMVETEKSFLSTMIKIIFMNLNYKSFLVMMFSENSDNRYLANKEGS